MSIDNTPADGATQEVNDLDTFSDDFFGQKESPKEETVEEPETPVEEVDANEEDAQDEDDTLATDEEDAEEEEVVETPAPKKNRAQERINELTRERHEADRKAAALAADLAEVQRRLDELTKTPAEVKPAPTEAADTGPKGTDLNEDGSDKYPLGEYDPAYLRDFMKHTLSVEREQQESNRKQAEAQQAIQAELAAVQESWNEKLTPVKERYPDFDEKSQALTSTFDHIDSAYGEYLATTIMSMDYGPDVLYHLANNPEEADAIVKSGPTKATIALGRLETRFMAEDAKASRPVKPSKAPPPPPANKGSSTARSVTPDTDDLDAFSSLLFKE